MDITDRIKIIDKELLKLHSHSLNKKPYKYFNFHGALEKLIQLIIETDSIPQYFQRISEYYNVYHDLFESDKKVEYIRILSLDLQNRRITEETTTTIINENNIPPQIKERALSNEEYLLLISNHKEPNKIIGETRINNKNLYDYLLEGVNKLYDNNDTGFIKSWTDRKPLDEIFGDISPVIKANYQNSFSLYIEKLLEDSRFRIYEYNVEDTLLRTKFSQNQISDVYDYLIKFQFLEGEKEYFLQIFSFEESPFIEEKTMIWNKTLPIFIALFLGFTNKSYENKLYSFSGIIVPDLHNYIKRILYHFAFTNKKRISNKIFSSEYSKFHSRITFREIGKILVIIKSCRLDSIK